MSKSKINPEQWLDDVAVDSILLMASKNSFLNKLYVQVSVLMTVFYREVQFHGTDGYIPIREVVTMKLHIKERYPTRPNFGQSLYIIDLLRGMILFLDSLHFGKGVGSRS